MLKITLHYLAGLAAALCLSACSAPTGLDFLGGGRLQSITLSASGGPVVEVGDTIRLTAIGTVDGLVGLFHYAPILDAVWATTDPSVARLEALPAPPPDDPAPSARTLVRGIAPGTARVSASSGGVTGEVPVRVLPRIAAIQLLATKDTGFVGDTMAIMVSITEETGADIADVPLTFNTTGGARVGAWNRPALRVIATALGPATVSAHFRGTSGQITLTIVPRAP